MEKGTTEKEIHDFMNVESFSQLPFIRPGAATKEKGIRLFGKEFGGHEDQMLESVGTANNIGFEEVNKDNEMNGESVRKFECHYCCRNFPTSQALGGHQNAHKRERQHAKRAHLDHHLHLQSALLRGSGTGSFSSHPHIYGGLTTYGTASVSKTQANSMSMSCNYYNTHRPYGGFSSSTSSSSYCQPLINGSPLALWRIPVAQNSSTINSTSANPLQFLGRDEQKPSPPISGSIPHGGYSYESKSRVHDHVSLDLHL